jgi:hypothetical protein
MTLTYTLLSAIAAASLTLAAALIWLLMAHPVELLLMVEGLIS